MLKIFTKIKKIKEVILKVKTLIIILVVLVVVGWGFAIYFGLEAQKPTFTCADRLEKLHSYSLLLDESVQLVRQDKSLDVLEIDVRLLDNGTLLAEWENVVFGGNREEDLNYYFDVIIDSLKFFSK